MGRRSELLCRQVSCLALVLAVILSLPLIAIAQSEQKGDLTKGVEKDDPFARLNAQEQQNGKVTPAYRDKVLREAQKHNQRLGRDSSGAVLGTPGQPSTGPAWINIGPFGQQFGQNGSYTGDVVDSGRLRTILTHPTDGNIVYILSSAGGLWKTTNFESATPTWTPLTDFLPTTAGGAAAFGKTPSVIYLGLGDPYDQITVGGSIVKSTDGGTTWSNMIPLGLTISVRDVKVDTSATNDIVLVATDGGLFRSTDAGATYNQVTGYAFQNQYIWSLVQTNAGWLMATQETQAQTNGSCIVGTRWCTGAGHIYLSTDKGATWAEQTNGLSVVGRMTLAAGGTNNSVAYAFAALPASGTFGALGTSAATNQRDLFRSSDGGKTWVALGVNSTKAPTNPQPGYAANLNVMSGQAWYNQTLLVDPSDTTGNTVILGGTLFAARTTDGGATWKVLSEWLPGWAVANGLPAIPYVHADMHAMAYKSAGTAMTLLGTDGGIFASTDKGDTWDSTKNTNLVTHMFYTLIGNPMFPNFAMGGTQDNGTRVRVDNTGIFNQSTGGDGFGVGFSQANAETALQTVYNLSTRRSRTQLPPKNYTEMQTTLGAQPDGGFYTPIFSPAPAADPSGLYFFSYGAAGSAGHIYFTPDGGMSWWYLNQIGAAGSGLPAGTAFRDNPFGFGISPVTMDHMAIGANGGRCFVSLDGGATWASNLATDSVPGWQGFVGNVTWGDDNTIYVTSTTQTEGLYNGVPTARVVKSTDQGLTWTAAGAGLPDVPVTKVQVDPRDATGKTVYAATHVGVYRTTDGGGSWTPYGAGLPNVRVNDIYMPPDGGYLRIATYGRGIWQLSSLDYLGATMTDDGNSCEQDGNVGNNETGHMTLTFSNPTAAAITGGTVTVASDNAHLAFTAGNSASLGTIPAKGTASVTFQVKVEGATGIEVANLTIAYGDTAVATIKQPIAFNYDDKAAASGSTVTFESKNHGWSINSTNALKPGDNFFWERRELTPVRHTMAVTNANGNQDTRVVSPVLKVGAAAFGFSFTHRYNFENGWDGGIIEISTDGTTWTQIPAASITANPYNLTLNAAPGNDNVLAGVPAYTGVNAGWPAYIVSTVDLGTTYANQQNLHIRFRASADSNTGRQGWEISDMSFTGLTNTPFGTYVAHNEACPSTVTLVSGPQNPTNFPDQVTFTATVLGGVTPVTGDVSFKEGATVLGTSTTAAGVATFNTITLPVGTHNIVAAYLGDAGHAVTNSAPYKHTVLAVPRTDLPAAPLAFGDVRTGTTSPVLTAPLKNTGTAPLIITNIGVTGAFFTQTNNCSTSLAAGATCTISVTFKPVAVQGAQTGTVTVSANGVSGLTTLGLTGNATRTFAGLSKTSLPFANTMVAATTAAQTVTVTNTGNLPLTIATVAISAGDFAITDDCTAAPLAAAATCTISATFTPTATGNRTATVTITSDADNSPQTIALAGRGENLQISGTTSQTVAKTATATFPLTLTASSGFSGTVTLACTGAPALTTCAISPASTPLVGSGTAAVAVTVTPAPTTTTASASHTGQILFAMFGLFGLMLVPITRREAGRKVMSMVLLALVLTVSVGGMVACGGNDAPPPHTPVTTTTYATPGTYTLTVTASSGATVLQTQNLTLTLQ
jgi:hypothetical protein